MKAHTPAPVLIVIQSLGAGGSERQAAAVATHLNRKKFQVHVAYVNEGFLADTLRQAGIPLLKLPLTSFTNRSAWRTAALLRRYIRDHGIRLVHTFDYIVTAFAAPVCATTDAVVLSSQRCLMELVPGKYRWMVRLAHHTADGIVVNCRAIRNELATQYHYPAGRIHVCYNGLDTARFQPGPRRRLEELRGASLVIGTVCVLRPEKNLPALLKSFAAVAESDPGLRLLIVGSGPEEPRLRSEAEQLGIAGACLFHPATPEVPECLRSMDIFVHPSFSEGLSNAVMEAMAAGCAVVCSDAGGSPELVTDQETGLLFDAGDVEALTSRLRLMVTGSELRLRLAAAGAIRIHRDFAITAAVEHIEHLYQRFLPDV